MLFLAAYALSACSSSPPPPPYKPVADLKQLMASVVEPAAEVYWDAVGTVIDQTGTHEIEPKTIEEWEAVRNAAYVVAESGNLMMMPTRAKDDGDWMKFSAQLVDVGMKAAKAAEEKDKDKVLEEGGNVYTVCTNCHMKYAVDADAGAPQ